AKRERPMKLLRFPRGFPIAAILWCLALLAAGAFAGIKNMAVVVAAGSKLSDVSLADLAKLCRGTQKTWPDGKNFTLVVEDPESPDMNIATRKLFGGGTGSMKATLSSLNGSAL